MEARVKGLGFRAEAPKIGHPYPLQVGGFSLCGFTMVYPPLGQPSRTSFPELYLYLRVPSKGPIYACNIPTHLNPFKYKLTAATTFPGCLQAEAGHTTLCVELLVPTSRVQEQPRPLKESKKWNPLIIL